MRPDEHERMNAESELPFITVVVPARNEARYITRTIGYLQKQDYPPGRMEILVVDGMSDDGTAGIVSAISQGDPRVRLLHNPLRLSSGGRNVGIRHARGDIITFIDAHVYIDNNQLLHNTARLMREKNVKVLSRPQFLDTAEYSWFQKVVALVRRSRLGHGLDSTIYLTEDRYVDPYSAGATYAREVFDAVGLYNERFDAAEDVEFNLRVGKAGFKAFSSMDVAVYYYARGSFPALFAQMKRYGIGRARLLHTHGAGLTSGPAGLVVFFMLIAALILASPWCLGCACALGGLAALYVLAAIADCVSACAPTAARFFWIIPAVLLCVHLGLAWGFVTELIALSISRMQRAAQQPEEPSVESQRTSGRR